ncbi:MAG: hypothetical protein AAF889_05575 [Cyanobacteria bacterium P01_D01_bin.73]
MNTQLGRAIAVTSIAIAGLPLGIVHAQEGPSPASEGTGPVELVPVDQVQPSSSVLSLSGGAQLLDDAQAAVTAQNYDLAEQRLRQARQIFNQLSNFHQQLAGAYSGIDNQISENQRRRALEAAEQRDRSTYRLALVHRFQGKPELAIPLLVQIVGSQSPTRDLGIKATQQLRELGFIGATDTAQR